MKMRQFLSALMCALGLASAGSAFAQPQQALDVQVLAKAELAVTQFQKRAGGRLDYSEKSLGAIEEMLDEAAQYSKQMPQTEVTALVELMGSYILAVAHRKYGGTLQWHGGRSQPTLVVGEPKFHVALMTFDKVRARVSGDKADNIVFFYEGFSSRVKSATPGTRVLYV
jgi:hypothetical protein